MKKQYITSYKSVSKAPYAIKDRSCDSKRYRELYAKQNNEEPYYGDAEMVVKR